MATVLLTIKCFRTGNDVVAGGFLVFAIGEGVLLSSAAADPESGIPSFAAGITLWGTALLLVSIPRLFALPVRIIGIVSAIPTAVPDVDLELVAPGFQQPLDLPANFSSRVVRGRCCARRFSG